jgi:hypothetical protein
MVARIADFVLRQKLPTFIFLGRHRNGQSFVRVQTGLLLDWRQLHRRTSKRIGTDGRHYYSPTGQSLRVVFLEARNRILSEKGED